MPKAARVLKGDRGARSEETLKLTARMTQSESCVFKFPWRAGFKWE